MSTRQALKGKLLDLRLKGMADELDPVMEHAAAHNLDLLSTLERLADLELDQRFRNAIALRWRQSKLTDKLTTLRLKGMAQQLDTVMERATQAKLDPLTILHRLADLELEQRWHSAIVQRWRQSALREKRTIDQFDFDHHASRKEQKTRILELLNLDFVAAHRDVIFIGNPGTGKTFLATCLAYAACNANIKVLFTTAMDMINQLIAAEADHSLLKKLHYYHAPDVLVCDELGYLSLGQQGSHLFCQVISQPPT